MWQVGQPLTLRMRRGADHSSNLCTPSVLFKPLHSTFHSHCSHRLLAGADHSYYFISSFVKLNESDSLGLSPPLETE